MAISLFCPGAETSTLFLCSQAELVDLEAKFRPLDLMMAPVIMGCRGGGDFVLGPINGKSGISYCTFSLAAVVSLYPSYVGE